MWSRLLLIDIDSGGSVHVSAPLPSGRDTFIEVRRQPVPQAVLPCPQQQWLERPWLERSPLVRWLRAKDRGLPPEQRADCSK